MYAHIADAIKAPAIVRLKSNLYVARFETLKVYSTLIAVDLLLRAGAIDKTRHSSTAPAACMPTRWHGLPQVRTQVPHRRFKDGGQDAHGPAAHSGCNGGSIAATGSLRLDQRLRVARINELLRSHADNLSIVGGIITALRNMNADVELVGVEPFGSVIFGTEHIVDPGIIMPESVLRSRISPNQ